MKKQNKNPFRTTVSPLQCICSTLCYLLLLGIVCLTVTLGGIPIPGRYFPFLQIAWVSSIACVLLFRMHVIQRLLMFYLPRKNSLLRLGLLFLLICLPPILEIIFLIKTKKPQEVYSFWLEPDQFD